MSKFPVACLIILSCGISIFLILGSCIYRSDHTELQATSRFNGYDLANPDLDVTLPSILQEISGLTDIDDHTIACVQDEMGTVFIYNTDNQKIERQFTFAGAGDYEGITRVGNTLYVMRSDAKLYEIENYTDKNYLVKEYPIETLILDNEGLAYDPLHNRLLIAGKSESKKKEHMGSRLVYSFDLVSKTLSAEPIYAFKEAQMSAFVKEKKISLPAKGKKKGLKINPSAISVHPITGDVFVLSSKGGMLYVFDQKSNLIDLHPLSRKDFSQPEGITFLENGDMFVSNEGRKGKPSLMKFQYQAEAE